MNTQRPYRLVDAHQHNGPWPFPGRYGDVEQNVFYMKRYGLDAIIISSSEAIVSDMVRGNARLAQAIADKPGVYGYVTVNPNDIALSCQQMDQYYAQKEFVGSKIHPSYAQTPLSSPKMLPLIQEIAKRGRPTLIHTWGVSEVRALAGLAARFPNWNVLMAHGGGDAWRDSIAIAAETPNIYLEFCCSAVERGKVERAVERLGPERVLFGSDTTLFDTAYILGMYEEAELSPEAERLVMGENAIRLFQLTLD